MRVLLSVVFLVGAVAHADSAIVSGNSVSSRIYLFDAPAQRMFEILNETGAATKEDLGSCVELRSQNIVCSQDNSREETEYICLLGVDSTGSVEATTGLLCPRP